MTILFIIMGIWFFCWIIEQIKSDSPTNLAHQNASQTNQSTSQQHKGQQASSQQYQNDRQQSGSKVIESWFPFIDVYTYYALDDNRSWTSEKVRFIKHILSDDLTSEWDNALLKERLKLTNQRSINDLMHELRIYLYRTFNDEWVTEARSVIIILCRMLYGDGVSEQRVKEKATYMASFLGLQSYELQVIYEKVFPKQQQQSNSSQQQRERSQQSNQQQSSSNQNNSNQHQNNQNNDSQDKTKSDQNQNRNNQSHSNNGQASNSAAYEWACSVLGLEPHDVTPERVQKAYRSKIKEYHPDKHQNLPEAIQQLLHEKTQEVNEAREILS